MRGDMLLDSNFSGRKKSSHKKEGVEKFGFTIIQVKEESCH